MQSQYFKFFVVFSFFLLSIANAQTPVIRGSGSSLEEYQKYVAETPHRIVYIKALLSKKLDAESNQMIDSCLDLQFNEPDKAEDSCEQALTFILKKPMTFENKNIIKEMLNTLDQKSIFKKNKHKWNSFLLQLRKKVSKKRNEPKDISVRQIMAWLKTLRQRPGFEDAALFVNSESVEFLNFIDSHEINHWSLLSNAFLPVITLGSFSDFEENYKTQRKPLITGDCTTSKLEELDGENTYEVFFSKKCKKNYSNPNSLFPKYDFFSDTTNSFKSFNYTSDSQRSWVYPAIFAGVFLSFLALKDKHIAIRWGTDR